ncbi:MAG: response regulator [Candidatus Thorarchaeota archaeon]
MLVDDDQFMHRVFERIMSIAGHDVVEHAYDGQEAVEKYACLNPYPDIIIMDHRMPLKDGVSATRELMDINPTIKILFVSADESVREKALDAGAIGFLSKPIRSRQFLTAIEEALGIVPATILR